MEDMFIQFYKASGTYGFLSNLYPAEIYDPKLDKSFQSSEHYYQYHKFKDKEIAEWAIQAPKPRFIAVLAHNLFIYDIVPNWKDIKLDVMRKAIKLKFEQNPVMKQMLRDTKDKCLIEASKTDSFWGLGKNGKGKNMLGKLLMEYREKIGVDK